MVQTDHEIEDFGFKIYRLRQAQENSEFLLFDTDKLKYNQFSVRRGKDMLRLEIEKLLNMELGLYMIKQEYIDDDEKNISKATAITFNRWITKEIKIIDNINYIPEETELFKEDEDTYFNTYRKEQILNEDIKDVKDKFKTIKKVILNLVGHDEDAYTYLTKWIAWQIQNPTKRLATSIILQGEQGTGKTLFCTYVLRYIFNKNFCEVGQSDINKEHNDYIMGKQIIVANEVIHSDTKYIVSEKLKNYVSDDYVSIIRKYRDSLNVRNYAQWIFVSNNQVPIKIEKGDRRYSVFRSKKLKDGFQLFQTLKENQHNEVLGFIKYLKELEVRFDEVNTPFHNMARNDLIEANLNSIESFFGAVEEQEGIDNLNKQYTGKTGYGWKNDLKYIVNSNTTYITLDCLYKLYLRFCDDAGIKKTFGRNGFTSMLKHLNYRVTVTKDEEKKSCRVMELKRY